MRAYRAGLVAFALIFIGIGLAMVVVTARSGGGIGYFFGSLFLAAGAGRLFLLRARR